MSPLTYHSTALFYGLTSDKQTGVLIAGAGLWLALGGKVIFRNGKLVTFLPSCELCSHWNAKIASRLMLVQ